MMLSEMGFYATIMTKKLQIPHFRMTTGNEKLTGSRQGVPLSTVILIRVTNSS